MRQLAVVLLAMAVLAGCRSTHDIERVYVHDTLYATLVQYDSVDRWHTHYEYLKGDTILIRDSFYLYKWKVQHDTLNHVDIEYKDVEKEVLVEKKRYVWWPGAVVALLCMGGTGYLIIKKRLWK